MVQINIGMQKLTNKEEEIMIILWRLNKAFVKEIMAEMSGNKPHYNTLSTIVRNLEEKKFVAYEAFGKTHRYYPLVTLEAYRKHFVNSKLVGYFDNSYKSMVSLFAKEERITVEELKEIINLIEKKK